MHNNLHVRPLKNSASPSFELSVALSNLLKTNVVCIVQWNVRSLWIFNAWNIKIPAKNCFSLFFKLIQLFFCRPPCNFSHVQTSESRYRIPTSCETLIKRRLNSWHVRPLIETMCAARGSKMRGALSIFLGRATRLSPVTLVRLCRVYFPLALIATEQPSAARRLLIPDTSQLCRRRLNPLSSLPALFVHVF